MLESDSRNLMKFVQMLTEFFRNSPNFAGIWTEFHDIIIIGNFKIPDVLTGFGEAVRGWPKMHALYYAPRDNVRASTLSVNTSSGLISCSETTSAPAGPVPFLAGSKMRKCGLRLHSYAEVMSSDMHTSLAESSRYQKQMFAKVWTAW